MPHKVSLLLYITAVSLSSVCMCLCMQSSLCGKVGKSFCISLDVFMSLYMLVIVCARVYICVGVCVHRLHSCTLG